MKYKLKKDLPFAKAGMNVRFSLEVEQHPKFYLCSQDVTDFNSYWITFEGDRDDLKGLIDEGWLEEIKPREWILEIDIALNGEVSHAVRPANAKGRMLHKDSELVKVREVI